MARKAEEIEEAILEGDQHILQREAEAAMPAIRVKAIYLGAHPFKSFRLQGTVARAEYDDERGDKQTIVSTSMAGYTLYTFHRNDTLGRPLVDSMIDDRPFSYVEHAEHALEILKMRGDDNSPQFRLMGPKADMEAIRRYALTKIRTRNPEDGLAVLEAMGLTAGSR